MNQELQLSVSFREIIALCIRATTSCVFYTTCRRLCALWELKRSGANARQCFNCLKNSRCPSGFHQKAVTLSYSRRNCCMLVEVTKCWQWIFMNQRARRMKILTGIHKMMSTSRFHDVRQIRRWSWRRRAVGFGRVNPTARRRRNHRRIFQKSQ